MSPTQRTLKYFRDQNYPVAIVEHWNPFAKIRQDLFGIIDLIVMIPSAGRILGVQCTSRSNHAARVKKLLTSQYVKNWVSCARLEVISWEKGKKEPKITEFHYAHNSSDLSTFNYE